MHRHNLCVVVTNHVTDVVDNDMDVTTVMALEQVCANKQIESFILLHIIPLQRFSVTQATGGMALRTSGRRVSPCLGLSWAHCVTTRLFLSRATPPGQSIAAPSIRRSLRVVFAPHLAPGQCAYTVAREGVRGADEVWLVEPG
jgi:Rad51